MPLFDQDGAVMPEGEGAEETEREQEKRGLRGGRKAGAGLGLKLGLEAQGVGLVFSVYG